MRPLPLTTIACAILGLSIASAHASPCSDAIAQAKAAASQSTGNAAAGPTAQQSIGAQLGRQPTPESVQRAEEGAQTRFAAVLGRAQALDAEGKTTECMQAVTDAQLLLGLK
jgi:hypothetical protein